MSPVGILKEPPMNYSNSSGNHNLLLQGDGVDILAIRLSVIIYLAYKFYYQK